MSDTDTFLGDRIERSFSTITLGSTATHLLEQDKYLLQTLLAACMKAVTKEWSDTEPPKKTE